MLQMYCTCQEIGRYLKHLSMHSNLDLTFKVPAAQCVASDLYKHFTLLDKHHVP
jgi:hypothetical protein